METLGTIFEGLIRPLLLWIREDSVGPALAGLIVIAGTVIIIYAFIGTVRRRTSTSTPQCRSIR